MSIHKTHDYIHRYHGCWQTGGSCRIEIFREDGRPPIIICSELPTTNGNSITAMAEYLAAEVALAHFPAAFEELGEPLVWLEQCPPVPEMGVPAVYTWVTFESYAPRLIGLADGVRRVALGRAYRTHIDRETVEEFIAARRDAFAPPARVTSAIGTSGSPAASR